MVIGDRGCYAPHMENEKLEPALAWIASVIAVGLLGAGVYAVFYSTNGSGTVALLTIGSLALFVIAFRDRMRSMEFGGARVQLALRVKDSLKRAFKLRLSGNYEGAEEEIEFAFSQFVAQKPPNVRQAYGESTEYQARVLALLRDYVEKNFNGRVKETASTVSFLPMIDAVMIVDGKTIIDVLAANHRYLCSKLTERVKEEGELRTAVIVRPGPALDSAKLADRLDREVAKGALGIDCFLLVQNCKESASREQFCNFVNGKDMHAKSMVWEPASGPEMLYGAFLEAILAICDPAQCGFTHAASRTQLNAASQPSVTTS
jgi:hypothetical protein